MKSGQLLFAVVLVALVVATPSFGQQSFMDEPGIPAFTTAFPVEHGFINLANGNLHIEIPIATYPQRGNIKALHARLVYDSRFWSIRTDPVTQAQSWVRKPPGGGIFVGGGFRLITDGEAGVTGVTTNTTQCGCINFTGTGPCQPQLRTTYSNFTYQEPNGTIHRTGSGFSSFKLYQTMACTGQQTVSSGTAYAIDNSGYKFVISNFSPIVLAPDGTQVAPAVSPGTPMDTNGNFFTAAPGQVFHDVVDTLGRTPVITTFSGNQTFLDYLCEQGCNPTNGDRARVTLNVEFIQYATHFNCLQQGSLVNEYSGLSDALSSIVFPDGSSYQFQYDAYGQITGITLPTGGQISYTYDNFSDFTGYVNRWVTSRTVDGKVWAFTIVPLVSSCTTMPCPQQVTVTTPSYNDGAITDADTHVYTFSTRNGDGAGAWLTQAQYFRGAASGSPALTKTTDYGVAGACPAVPSFGNAGGFPIRDTLIWPSGSGTLSKKAEYCYDSFSNKTATKEWDYQPNGNFAAAPDREIDNSYKTDPSYINANIINLPLVSTSFGPGHAQTAQTTYGYDETSVQPSNTTEHHTTPTSPRANLTSISKWLNTSTSPVVGNTTWYDSGEIYQSKDPLAHTATIYYDSTGAYPNKVCNALNQCSYSAHDFNTGLTTSFTDANGTQAGDPAHTTSYTFDPLLRLLCTNLPDGGQSCLAYPDANHGSRQQKVTASLTDPSTTVFDGLGRVSQTQHTLPDGVAKVDITYDPAGSPSTASNPYFTTADPTYGITQSFHDALGRGVKTIRQDGSISSTAYGVRTSGTLNGTCATGTDEAGKKRVACHNGFGELLEVDEPGASYPGAQAMGSIDIGPIKTAQVGGSAAVPASAQVTISGIEHSKTTIIRCTAQQILLGCEPSSFTAYDNGKVFITIGGHEYDYFFGGSDTSVDTNASVAQGLVLAIQGDPARLVNAAVPLNGTAITLNAVASGTSGNGISFTTGYTWNTTLFPTQGASFTAGPAGGPLAGGQDAVPESTVTDHGTVTLSAGSFTTPSISYGPGTANLTAASVATASASALSAPGSGVSATTNGGTQITVTENAFGVSGNGVSVSTHPVSADPADFPSPSFGVGSSSLSGGIDPDPSGLTLPFVTQYQYDALGNLLRVDQKGSAPSDSTQWRTRTFTYDSLSRLLTATNPESGTITYLYDADGELLQKTSPAPNQTGTATTTFTFCYDALHRMLAKGYVNSPNPPQQCTTTPPWLPNPTVVNTYDQATNATGKLTSLTDQAGTGSYVYDILGRLTTETRTIAGVSKSTGYAYNLDGSVKTLTYPSGRVVTYTPDFAGRLVSAVDGNGTNYGISATYWPDGSLKTFLNGSFPALNSSFQYNPRLQLCRITTLTSGTLPNSCTDSQHTGNVMDRGYDFHLNAGNNGNVFAITNYRDTTRSQAFTYDALNRLVSGLSAANTGTYSWGENYSIDAWGNLQIAPMPSKAHGGHFPNASDVTNRPLGLGYDAAGNLTNYTAPGQYVYDAENRLSSSAGMSYTYDGNGERVLKSNTSTGAAVKRYWSMGGNTLAEGDGTGNLTAEYIYFGGNRVARIDLPANTVHYYLSDHLGSTSIVASASGAVEEESDYYPFGTEVLVTGGPNKYKFTGKERDPESGLDLMGLRYYSNALGRFTSSDPEQAAGFDHMDDPQAWNGYAYVRNNPLKYVDPEGDSFFVCDEHGQNCGHAGDDAKKNAESAGEVWKDGKIYFRGDDGNLQFRGTYRDEGQDIPGDRWQNIAAAGQIVATTNAAMKEFGRNAAWAAVGGVIGVGIEVFRAARAAKAGEEVVYLYQKVSATGEHLKFGITKNPNFQLGVGRVPGPSRYSAGKMGNGALRIVASGTREEMEALEHTLHSTLPIGSGEGQSVYIQIQTVKGLKPPPY
jgi:RHS repeat-associated protein